MSNVLYSSYSPMSNIISHNYAVILYCTLMYRTMYHNMSHQPAIGQKHPTSCNFLESQFALNCKTKVTPKRRNQINLFTTFSSSQQEIWPKLYTTDRLQFYTALESDFTSLCKKEKAAAYLQRDEAKYPSCETCSPHSVYCSRRSNQATRWCPN